MSSRSVRRIVLVGFFLLACTFNTFSQDSTIYKTAYAGGYLVVPSRQSWVIDRAFINSGGSYNIQISNSNFNALYPSGDTLILPYYVAEMELLDQHDMVQYHLTIKVRTTKE